MDYTWRRATRQRRRGKIRQTNLDQRQCTAPSSFLKTILPRPCTGNTDCERDGHSPFAAWRDMGHDNELLQLQSWCVDTGDIDIAEPSHRCSTTHNIEDRSGRGHTRDRREPRHDNDPENVSGKDGS